MDFASLKSLASSPLKDCLDKFWGFNHACQTEVRFGYNRIY